MEKQGMKWQIVVGSLLLLALVASLFFPAFKITGDKYIESAMQANKHAEKQDLDAAKEAGTKKVTDNYKRKTKKRKEKAKEFDKEIKKNKGKVSGIQWIRWSFSGKKISVKGVTYVKEKDKSKEKNSDKKDNSNDSKEKVKDINKSGVKTVFRMMAVLLLLPPLCALMNLVFMLVRRKTYRVWMLITALLEAGCMAVFYFVAPGMIWNKSSSYIDSATLLSEKTLRIKGTGKTMVTTLMKQCLSLEVYVGLVVATLLLIFVILCFTVCRPATVERGVNPVKGDFDPGEWVIDNIPGGTSGSGFGMVGESGFNNFPKMVGKIYGISGQYQGSELEIQDGEEIVLGRDPQYCGLVFRNPKVSRRHCGIRYDGQLHQYQVIDYSSNGTRFVGGGAAKAGMYTTVPEGTVLIMGGSERIRLGG
ncbi:MAG: FHA domain-containing protein [Lachnospiraceae bacterium]|nr:FHA domain-containing protein [Lachnospiraceae bacterium]